MLYRLRLVDYAELEKAMTPMCWLIKLGDWNIAPVPHIEVTWDEYIYHRARRTPRFWERRQLLDLLSVDKEMASVEIQWFWDCGLLQVFPGEQDLESEEFRFLDQGQYFWVGCRHEYETLVAADIKSEKPKPHEHIQKCKMCGHVKSSDSSG